MFLCDSCHDPKCPMEFAEDMMRSGGRCEGCGKYAACYDCHGYKLASKPKIKCENCVKDTAKLVAIRMLLNNPESVNMSNIHILSTLREILQ